MPRTLGYHYVKTCYGLWLPGDQRGHWSEAWDEQIGFYGPDRLHPGDPVRLHMAQERMKHPPVKLTAVMMAAVEGAIGRCANGATWTIAAAAIEPTHIHLLITYSELQIERIAKWLAQETTKAVHRETTHTGPVWARGYWCTYVFEHTHWDNVVRYIERHNVRKGTVARPYPFITAQREEQTRDAIAG